MTIQSMHNPQREREILEYMARRCHEEQKSWFRAGRISKNLGDYTGREVALSLGHLRKDGVTTVWSDNSTIKQWGLRGIVDGVDG